MKADPHNRIGRYKSGLSLRNIAIEDGVSPQAIFDYLKNRDVDLRPRGGTLSEEVQSRGKRYLEGQTVDQIAESDGVSRRRVFISLQSLPGEIPG